MTEKEYWGKLSGYWRLFKDKDVFTELWGAMLRGCGEYAELWAQVNHPGILSCPQTVTLRWERIVANNGGSIHILNSDNSERDYAVITVPEIHSISTSAIYRLDEHYSINDGVITWDSDPSEDSYLAVEVEVDPLFLEHYYNDSLFDLDLDGYKEADRKWVIYACLQYLGRSYSVANLANIVSILAGVPFSKYYGQMAYDSGECEINYAITIDGDYENYLTQRMLHNYCFINELTGDLYEGNYPPSGTLLTLCHKHNLSIDSHGRHHIGLRSESVSVPVGLYENTEEYGELVPVAIWGDIIERGFASQYKGTPIPLLSIDYSAAPVLTGSVPSGMEELIVDGAKMLVSYLDNLVIGGCEASDEGEISVPDPGLHIFEVGDSIVVEQGGAKSYVSISSGRYGDAEQMYYLSTHPVVSRGSLSIIVPRRETGVVQVGNNSGVIEFTLDLNTDNEPITIMPCDESIRSTCMHSVSRSVYAGDTFIRLISAEGIEEGDIVSISSDGEQDFYVITDIAGADIIIYPGAARDYASGAQVYNNKLLPVINTVSVEEEAGSDIWIKENIEKYMAAWDMGHKISVIADSNKIGPSPSSALRTDKRYWSPIGNGAIKENKE